MEAPIGLKEMMDVRNPTSNVTARLKISASVFTISTKYGV